ncbi:response regulator transcription factor [Terasakiella sp. SH-1]|uniref:response regulator transcription factor n=1 Tax=Terasakiella sp. SH-1 TaxID=2560057 RepID=UPI001074848D|nr:response regulator transcription factor [Terasakiella sp. SH-1]
MTAYLSVHVPQLLIIEDDEFASMLLTQFFENEGFEVKAALNAQEARKLFQQQRFHLCFLDLDLPDEDGLVLLRQFMAETKTPFFVLTGRNNKGDELIALELGAIEYLIKPVAPQELLLRVQNLIKLMYQSSDLLHRNITIGGWTLIKEAQCITNTKGQPTNLTPGEFKVLSAMFNEPNKVLSRDFLLDTLNSAGNIAGSRSIDVIISRLRKKVEKDPAQPEVIKTVAGAGYMVKN